MLIVFLIYIVVALLNAGILIVINKYDEYDDEFELTYDLIIVVSVFWPILYIAIIGFIIVGLVLGLFDELKHDLTKKDE